MERYVWRDGKIRLRLEEAELEEMDLTREALLRFDGDARRRLRDFILTLQEDGLLPRGELLAELFPIKQGAVLQFTAKTEETVYYLAREDDMLAVFPLVRAAGAALFRRLDGKGYYVAHANEKGAARFSEFASPCRVPKGVLKENCRRIL